MKHIPLFESFEDSKIVFFKELLKKVDEHYKKHK